ncbi:hypothetical protein U1Q18_000940, partial [Sarracenia purpurea var. burkii]
MFMVVSTQQCAGGAGGENCACGSGFLLLCLVMEFSQSRIVVAVLSSIRKPQSTQATLIHGLVEV